MRHAVVKEMTATHPTGSSNWQQLYGKLSAKLFMSVCSESIAFKCSLCSSNFTEPHINLGPFKRLDFLQVSLPMHIHTPCVFNAISPPTCWTLTTPPHPRFFSSLMPFIAVLSEPLWCLTWPNYFSSRDLALLLSLLSPIFQSNRLSIFVITLSHCIHRNVLFQFSSIVLTAFFSDHEIVNFSCPCFWQERCVCFFAKNSSLIWLLLWLIAVDWYLGYSF